MAGQPDVKPVPDLADVPMKDAPAEPVDPAGGRPDDPPASDLTLPTE